MRKATSLLLVCLFALLFAVPAQALALGDLDGNGKVTAKDARLALRISARLETANEAQRAAADADGDGNVTAKDARIILRVSARLTTFEEIHQYPTPIEPSSEEVSEPSSEPFIPVRFSWLMLGNSLTDLYNRPQNYPYWIARRNPDIKITNMAIAGSLVCWNRDNKIKGRQVVSIFNQAQQHIALDSNPDVIQYSPVLTTFYGGFRWVSRNKCTI